jgi:hypothetical protein
MDFDELYATHGNSACKAAETFRLRNRILYQGMVSGFVFSPDWLRRGAKWDPHLVLSTVHPSLAEPFRNLTLVFYLLVILVQNKIFIDNQPPQTHTCALSRKLLRILRRRFGIQTELGT